jgi:hypothetical protein
MNFKSWFILSEELYQNNTATIFHRTKSFEKVQGMMNGGFTAGSGDHHGPGLYTTYTLEGTTNLGYGDYVVKLKVNNLKNYFVLEPDIAQQIHGDNWKLKDQARILELTLNLTDEQWEKYQEISESGDFGSAAASQALKQDGHKLWEHGCKGIIYNGRNDGKCICVYAPYEGLQFLAYAHAPTPTTVDYIEKNWIKSGKDVSTRSTVNIRSISGFKFPKNIGSTSIEKQYEIENPDPNHIIPSEIFEDIKFNKYLKARLYLKNNKLTDQNVYDLLSYASDKEKIARILGQDNIDKLSGSNVYDLLDHASDKEKIARILGSKNINKLTDWSISDLLASVSDKEKMAEILVQNNIDKLNDDSIYYLLSRADDKEKMARILGSKNINKLNSENVNNLLSRADDKDQMAIILGSKNINKLTGHDVKYLMSRSHGIDIEKMARVLGPDNINKLTGDDVKNLFGGKMSVKNHIIQMLEKYYTGKDSYIRSLIIQMKRMDIKEISS